jgi:hypothetical protein
MLQLFFALIAIAAVAAVPTNPWNAFSPANWPLPHNITGDSLTSIGQWSGVHVHDPSVVKGPDGFCYSFSTHNLVAISKAPSLDGYWEVYRECPGSRERNFSAWSNRYLGSDGCTNWRYLLLLLLGFDVREPGQRDRTGD